MRKRQISNMHGGYRGSGVTLDWHTTYKPTMIQVDNKPLQPVIPPSNLQPPTNDPPPTTPPQIVNKQSNKINEGALAAIVGLTTLAGGYAGYKYFNQERPQVSERIRARQDFDLAGERRGIPFLGRDVWGIMRDMTFHRMQGEIPEDDPLLSRSSGRVSETPTSADDRTEEEIREAERLAWSIRPHIELGDGDEDVVFHYY